MREVYFRFLAIFQELTFEDPSRWLTFCVSIATRWLSPSDGFSLEKSQLNGVRGKAQGKGSVKVDYTWRLSCQNNYRKLTAIVCNPRWRPPTPADARQPTDETLRFRGQRLGINYYSGCQWLPGALWRPTHTLHCAPVDIVKTQAQSWKSRVCWHQNNDRHLKGMPYRLTDCSIWTFWLQPPDQFYFFLPPI